jgi:hypothetical protein
MEALSISNQAGALRTTLQFVQAKILVAIEDFLASLARNPEFTVLHGHLLAIEQAGHKSESFVQRVHPGHIGDTWSAIVGGCNRISSPGWGFLKSWETGIQEIWTTPTGQP